MKSLPSLISGQEEKLKAEREGIEGALGKKTEKFKDDLKAVKEDIAGLRELGIKGQVAEALEKIRRINETLADLAADMQEINDNEQDLEFEISEHPMLKECKDEVGPFEDFWNLIKQYGEESQSWKVSKFKDMDPERISKDHKGMLQTQVKLVAKF
jgi:dynein heavy chain